MEFSAALDKLWKMVSQSITKTFTSTLAVWHLGCPLRVQVWESGHSPRSGALVWRLTSTPPSTEEGVWTGPEPFLLLQCLCGCVLYGAPDVLSSFWFSVSINSYHVDQNRNLMSASPAPSSSLPGASLRLLLLSFLGAKEQWGEGEARAGRQTGCRPIWGQVSITWEVGPLLPHPALPGVLEKRLPRVSERGDVPFHEGPNL